MKTQSSVKAQEIPADDTLEKVMAELKELVEILGILKLP